MTETFREATKAAGYVSSGLTHDFPDATAEVIRMTSHRQRQRSCSVADIEPTLAEMCKGLGSTYVDYHPNNAYGFVAEIRGAASDDSQPAPPRVFVLLKEVKGRPIAVGSQPNTRTPFDLD